MSSRPFACARWLAAVTILWLAVATAKAGEVRLNLPDPIVPEVVIDGEVQIENAPAQIANVVLPEVEGLEWQVLRQTSSRTSIIDGAATTVQSVGLALRAHKVGTFAIPPVTVRLRDNSELKSAPTTLTVGNGNPNLTGEAYVESLFEPAAIVAGEPTTLVLRIYLRHGEVNQLGVAPPAKAISLGERVISQGRCFDNQGRQWNIVTARWPLTFAEAGSYEARGQQPYQVTIDDGFFGRQKTLQAPVKPTKLVVAAMPAAGRPDDFTGLIGPLTVGAKLERNRIAAGEGTAIELTVTGRQVELLARPKLPAIAGIQAYPRDASGTPIAGSRSFVWDLVPAAAGDFTIPAFSFAYFDAGSHSYRRAETQPLTLNVLPGNRHELTVSGAAAKPQAAPAAPQRIAALDLPAPLRGEGGSVPSADAGWIALIAALAAGTALGCLGRWRAARPSGPHRGRALARAVSGRDLDAIAKALHDLAPALDSDARRHAAAALGQAVDTARFGAAPLAGDVAGWLATLKDIA